MWTRARSFERRDVHLAERFVFLVLPADGIEEATEHRRLMHVSARIGERRWHRRERAQCPIRLEGRASDAVRERRSALEPAEDVDGILVERRARDTERLRQLTGGRPLA